MQKNDSTILILFFLLATHLLNAQVTVGIRAGVNVASTQFASIKNSPQSINLFTMGVPVEVHINKRFSAQTELNFTQKGYKWAASDISFVTNWIETSIFGKLKLGGEKPIHGFLFFGPSLGFVVGGRGEFISPYDFGLNVGGQLILQDVFFDLRYQLGLTDLDTYYNPRWQIGKYSRGIAVSFGYYIFRK
jgi:hypothetical protein